MKSILVSVIASVIGLSSAQAAQMLTCREVGKSAGQSFEIMATKEKALIVFQSEVVADLQLAEVIKPPLKSADQETTYRYTQSTPNGLAMEISTGGFTGMTTAAIYQGGFAGYTVVANLVCK